MVRNWVKFWVNQSLDGTIRTTLTPAERSVWYDLIMLAGNCRLDGVISANETTPYNHKFIASRLNIPLKLLETTLLKCIEAKRIFEDTTGIHIINWTKYQSDYKKKRD